MNDKIQVVEHYAKRLSDNHSIRLKNDQLNHDSSMNHVLVGRNPDDYEIFHAEPIYEPFINFTDPFKVASLDDFNIYIHPYKMRKSR